MDLQAFVGKLTGNPEKDIKQLANFVFMQNEEIRYLLQNLDVTNFNDLGLARYENGRMQLYAEQVEIRAKALQAVLEDEIDGLGQMVTEIEATAEGLQTTVKGHTTTINSHTNSISSLNTKTTSLQSQITQTANKISAVVSAVDDTSGNVTAASIVAAINNAGSEVQITANHVALKGIVTVEDLAGEGTVEINAGNIVAGGTISGVALESYGNRSWEEIWIHDGMVEFYSGYIKDADTGTLQVYANSMLQLESDGYVYVFVGGRGKCWRIGSDGIYFCNNSTMTPTAYVPTTSMG